MSILTRADGTKFAVYTYRERLNAKNHSLFKREVQVLARENGTFATLKLELANEVEVILSPEQGYLLAELVALHFDNPDDLIYCEALEDEENALLVVVRAGSVYLDAYLPLANIGDELIALMSGENHYQIYVYGDVPLAEMPSDEAIAFDPSMVESFTQLDGPLFPTLALVDTYLLLPLEEALDNLKLPTSNNIKIIIFVIILGLLGLGMWKLLAPKPVTITPVVEQGSGPSVSVPPSTNPYASYQAALTTVSPSEVMISAAETAQLLLTIPGWMPTQMTFNGKDNSLSFNVKSQQGQLTLLLDWVKAHQVKLDASAGTPVLIFPILGTVRPVPTTMYNSRDTIASMVDILNRLLPDGKVSLGQTVQVDNFNQTTLTLSFSNLAPSMLVFLAKELASYPIVLASFTLTVNQGFLSGTMTLQLLGA